MHFFYNCCNSVLFIRVFFIYYLIFTWLSKAGAVICYKTRQGSPDDDFIHKGQSKGSWVCPYPCVQPKRLLSQLQLEFFFIHNLYVALEGGGIPEPNLMFSLWLCIDSEKANCLCFTLVYMSLICIYVDFKCWFNIGQM